MNAHARFFARSALALLLSACGSDDDEPSPDELERDASTEFPDSDTPEPDAEPQPDPDAGTDTDTDADAPDEWETPDDADVPDAGPDTRDTSALPYAQLVASFTPGTNAGFGADKFPAVVFGPPKGNGTGSGSLDVLSLGVGGQIVLDFGDARIVDGEGPDFIVFENPFWPSGGAEKVFAEPGEVSVSDDADTWTTFPCDPAGIGMGRYPGCAGWTPTLKYDPFEIVPLDPALTGGDAFDLAELGLESARYVRITDLSTAGQGQTAGFDLDAVGVIHRAE